MYVGVKKIYFELHKMYNKGTIVESMGSYSSSNASVVVANSSGLSTRRHSLLCLPQIEL